MIDQKRLLSLLACPACLAPLRSLGRCEHCGTTYSESQGTPVLIAPGATRTVSFEFTQGRSIAGDQFRRCFSYPPRREASAGVPYHLDLAHLEVIDRLPSGSLALEIGCGGGQMRKFLETKELEYIGIDISKSRVHEALQSHGGPDLLTDTHFLPFVDCAFDVVYSAAVTEHLACPFLAVQEVKRVLKPGGYYLGNVSFLEPWHDDSFFHMTPLGVFELLTQADLEIEHIWPGWRYHGFGALMRMGNRVTARLGLLGDALHFIYDSGVRTRNLVNRLRKAEAKEAIMDAARVAGATDWIAKRRSVEAPG